MASTGWETIGSSGKPIKKVGSDKTFAKKEAEAKKKFTAKAPKLGEVLPYSDVASVFSSVHSGKGKNGQTNGTKSPPKPKKPQEKKPDKKEVPKETHKPKNLEEAVKAVSSAHLKHLLQTTKSRYPDDPLLWIRDAAAYLNLSLALANNELTPSDFQHFSQKPLSVLSKEAKKTFQQLLEESGETSWPSAFETLLANMAHDMARGQCVQGYMTFLQILSELNPGLCLLKGAVARFAELRNSYQNRPNIGTALLWAVGLGGKKDLQTGLKVWIELMLPSLPLRHYSRFIVDYLKLLLKLHKADTLGSVPKTKEGARLLYPLHFFQMFDSIFTAGPSSLNKEVQVDLLAQYKIVKKLSIGDCDVDHELFPEFMRRLDAALKFEVEPQRVVQEIMVCLEQNLLGKSSQAAISHWKQMYRAYLVPSARLLQHLDATWDKTVSAKFIPDSGLEELIEVFQDFNEASSQQKEGISLASKSGQSLLDKMARKSESSRWFPWKLSTLLLTAGIVALINYDVTNHGSFKVSSTGRFLQDVGLYNETVETYKVVSFLVDDFKQWSAVNVPVYVEQGRHYVGPVADKIVEVATSGVDVIKTNVPVFTNKVNEYLPGIKEKIFIYGEEIFNRGENVITWTREHGLEYLQYGSDSLCRYAHLFGSYLKQGALVIGQCFYDIYDGKIDLKDVSEFAVSNFNQASKLVADTYHQWTKK